MCRKKILISWNSRNFICLSVAIFAAITAGLYWQDKFPGNRSNKPTVNSSVKITAVRPYQPGLHLELCLYQLHVRPMVRGKARNPVEFGAKVSISLIEGFSFVERIGWDAYNESCDLIEQIKRYRQRFGFYPESVHVDKIYRTIENRRFCKKHGIRISGPPLGRPIVEAGQLKARRKLQRQDELYRIAVEGKFGQGRRRFSLARVMKKLSRTSEVSIMVSFIVMNPEKILTEFFSFLLFV